MAENAIEQLDRMNRLFTEAVNDYEARDFDSALHKLKTARILWDTRPAEWEKDGCRFTLRSISELIEMIEKDQQAAASDGQYYRVPITHGRTTRPPYGTYPYDGYNE